MAIDVPVEDVQMAYYASTISRTVSLDKPIIFEDGSTTSLEGIITSVEPNFEMAIDNKHQIAHIFQRLKAVGIKDEITECLALKYLSDPQKVLSNQEVADILGVTPQTVGYRIKILIERIDNENLLGDTETFA